MSLKKFDLAKNLGLKVAGQMRAAGVPDRFAQGALDAHDRREQRKRDAAAGLVPFACKLPSDLTRRLQEMAPSHEGGLNALVAELLNAGLGSAGTGSEAEAPAADKPAAKKAPAKKAVAAKTGEAKEKAAKAPKAEAPGKAPAAKKAAAKKTVSRKP